MILPAVVLAFALAAPAQTAPGAADAPRAAPRFEDLRVDEVFDRSPAPVVLASPRARQFRTVLRNAARQRPNFAGHYRVATWGCGSDCHAFAIIDSANGTVYFERDALFVAGLSWNDEERVQFRKDSRLLVLVGARNDSGAGRYFYRWTGTRLEWLATEEVAPPPEDPGEATAGGDRAPSRSVSR